MAVHTHVFARLARSVARANGMPTTRQAFVPQPVVGRSPQELRAYVDGEDPVNGGAFMQHIIEGLTNPLGDDDLKGVSFDRSAPALLEPDTEDNLRARFAEERWTDFLPIVLPTEERVQAMLAGTSHAPDEIVGRMRPTAFREFWEFTVEKVAVNAVMAGAKPEYLPVILAMMAGGMTARSSSTTSFATTAMVNGPIRNEIEMNSGIGAFGPYNHANATIGPMNGSQAVSWRRKCSRQASSRTVPNCVYQPPRKVATVLVPASKPCCTWNGVYGLRSSFSAKHAL